MSSEEMYGFNRHNSYNKNALLFCDNCLKKNNINMNNIIANSVFEIQKKQNIIYSKCGIMKGSNYYHCHKTNNDFCSTCYYMLSNNEKISLELKIK